VKKKGSKDQIIIYVATSKLDVQIGKVSQLNTTWQGCLTFPLKILTQWYSIATQLIVTHSRRYHLLSALIFESKIFFKP
jgi:hypothetical protein